MKAITQSVKIFALSFLLVGITAAAYAAQPCQCEDTARVPGVLSFRAQPTTDVIVAPAIVRVGEVFQVTITTFGDGCDSAGDTGVVFDANGVTLWVYDITAATHPGVVCTSILKRLRHTVNISFDAPGERVIRVWGRRSGPELPPQGEPIVLEHRLTVT